VIHRYTEARDVIVAMPVTVRPDGASSTIGYTINVLPVRVVCEGNPSFADFADRVRVALTGALEHRELPLTDILAEWRRNQPLTSAAAPVMLVWQSHEHLLPSGAPLADDSLLDFGGIRATVTRLPSPRAQCDVVLSLAPSASGGISGRLHFDRRKWRADTISRLAGHFVTLLEDGVENPHRHIRQLALLTPPELSARRHPTTARTPPLVMERFEAQVQRTPDRVAVVCGADRLSYAMLASRIDALAHALRARGMGSGRAVGVCLPRSVDLVVALLGIWKARGVYVPLDPTVPTPRLVRYVRDAACEVVLSSADHMASAESDFGVPALGVAAHDSAVDSLATLDMGSPDDPAYVVFTSGSTGEPKGVEIEQRAVAALFDWAISHYEPDDLAGMLASTSISFDISLFELVTPLLAGGTVVVADSILSLPRLSYALTLINTVPSAARALLEADAFPSTTRTLNLAGEHLPQRLVDALYARTTIRRIYDLYGPTEDTVFSTAALRVPGGIDTIGTPIAGSRTYVVDAHLEPVPVGVPGELLLGGVKLARGYVRRPDLTADAFLTDLAANADAPRLYRTGDLARQLPDGRLQYLGRRDQQVKIRGFRIEPSEIEAQLARLPQVRRAAVVARASGDGEKRLVAYIVPAAGTDLDVEPLRAALAAQLPDYLMPSAFVMIRELPLNTNGKLDRSRLPEADRPEPRLCVAPRTPTEYRIHKLWESILPPSSFGVTDSFFSLGGDSLRVLRLHAGLNREFKVQIAPALLMSLPTIAALAASLDLVRTEPAVDAPEIIV
jgi:amino acid adenylation domain-containing protein